MFVINEISPASDPEWVEIYTAEPSNLQNCTLYLHEGTDTKQKIFFSESKAVENYFVVKKGEFNWSSNWLNNSGDTVSIKCADKEDSYTYSDIGVKTVGRSPDGSGGFVTLSESTPGIQNSSPTPPPTPSQTATPLPTPQPTDVPKQTNIPTVASIATELPTPKPTSNARVVETIVDSNEEPEELISQPTSSHGKYLFILAGFVFLAAGSFPFIKKLYNEKYAPNPKIP